MNNSEWGEEKKGKKGKEERKSEKRDEKKDRLLKMSSLGVQMLMMRESYFSLHSVSFCPLLYITMQVANHVFPAYSSHHLFTIPDLIWSSVTVWILVYNCCLLFLFISLLISSSTFLCFFFFFFFIFSFSPSILASLTPSCCCN